MSSTERRSPRASSHSGGSDLDMELHPFDRESSDAQSGQRDLSLSSHPDSPRRDSMALSVTTRTSSSASGCKEEFAGEVEDGGADGNSNQKAKVTRQQQIRIMLACILQGFWVLGINQSFGIFQAHYASERALKDGMIRSEEQVQRASIGAIQSLGNGGIVAVFAILFFPRLPLIGRHVRTLCCAAAVFTTLGFAIAASCTNVRTLVVTQGLLVGIGNGILFNVLTTVVPEYFANKAGLAQGVYMSCGGLGGLTLSLGLPEVLKLVGTRWTLGIMSILSAIFLGASGCLAQPPRKCQKRRTKPAGWGALRNPTFTLLAVVNLINPLTVAIPTTFGPEFSKTLGYQVRMASIILATGSLVGIPARFYTGSAADRYGHNNVLLLASLISSVSTLAMWLSAAHTNSKIIWIVYNIIYGCVSGVFNTLINSVQRGHFGDELYYSYNGALASIRGVGYLIGVPVAGALVAKVKDGNLQGADFTWPIVYTGTLLMVSVFCQAAVRWQDSRKNGWKWVK